MKKTIKIMKIIGIVVLILALVIGVTGFVAVKFYRNQLISLYLSTMPGNASEYAPKSVIANESSPLRGKTIIYLGSSVTYGLGSCGNSFVEYLEAIDGVTPVKEAVSGTTLVTKDDGDYIPRMQTIDSSIDADAFICQLSTNDATLELPLGKVTDSFQRENFDTQTVAGAIEYIISYANETWDCPVLFYTGTWYESEAYGKMVELLLQIQQKWGIGVIDMWNDEALNNISEADRALYMLDGIHPTRAGYLKWWMPFIESYLYRFLTA